MAISDELNRIIQAKAGIKSALEEKGLTIGDSSTLDEYPALIQEMQTGGGGSSADTQTLIDMIEGDITSIDIPNTAYRIGNYSLAGKPNLRNVNIPNSVTSFGSNAFTADLGLVSIIIPNSVTSFGDSCFSGCTSLSNIVIPSSVTSIGMRSFNNVNANMSLAIMGDNPPSLSTNTNVGTFGGSWPIYVKNAAVDTYKNAGGNWNDVSTRINPLASMSYDSQTYTVTASGRDNVELYVDASLCDSSVYTFDSTTQAGNHTVTVKSVDPSLGVLDEVSQEITI